MKTKRMIGLGLSVLGALPLFASGILFVVHHPTPVQNMARLGFEPGMLVPLGVTKIIIAALIVAPQTCFFGTILGTGWMGGAIASNLRVGMPPVVETIVPIVMWLGFALRNEEVMRLLLGLKARPPAAT